MAKRNHEVVRAPIDRPTVRAEQDKNLQTIQPIAKGHVENDLVLGHPLGVQAAPTNLSLSNKSPCKNWLETVNALFQTLSADSGSCSLLLAQIDTCGKTEART